MQYDDTIAYYHTNVVSTPMCYVCIILTKCIPMRKYRTHWRNSIQQISHSGGHALTNASGHV